MLALSATLEDRFPEIVVAGLHACDPKGARGDPRICWRFRAKVETQSWHSAIVEAEDRRYDGQHDRARCSAIGKTGFPDRFDNIGKHRMDGKKV